MDILDLGYTNALFGPIFIKEPVFRLFGWSQSMLPFLYFTLALLDIKFWSNLLKLLIKFAKTIRWTFAWLSMLRTFLFWIHKLAFMQHSDCHIHNVCCHSGKIQLKSTNSLKMYCFFALKHYLCIFVENKQS